MGTIIKACFVWHTSDLCSAYGLNSGGRVQSVIDNAVIRYDMPYCPWAVGTLAKSPYTASIPGKVIYETPYARYHYYGLVMGPNIPVFEDDSGEPTRFFSPPGVEKVLKVPEQAIVHNTDINPLAGPFWFERMKADHCQDIVEEARQGALNK